MVHVDDGRVRAARRERVSRRVRSAGVGRVRRMDAVNPGRHVVSGALLGMDIEKSKGTVLVSSGGRSTLGAEEVNGLEEVGARVLTLHGNGMVQVILLLLGLHSDLALLVHADHDMLLLLG